MSIGALNTAIIAGNPPERRVQRLAEFWETICQPNTGLGLNPFVEQSLFGVNDAMRQTMSAISAASAVLAGQKGFFQPSSPPPSMIIPGNAATASYYDHPALASTLDRLCHFDLLHSGRHQRSVCAEDFRTGYIFYYFMS